MVVCTCELTTWDTEAGLSVQGQHGLHSEFEASLSCIARPCFKTLRAGNVVPGHTAKDRSQRTRVYCGAIHKSQDMETAKMPTTDEWIKKMWCLYTVRNLFSYEEE
jgi:hypothetical protein